MLSTRFKQTKQLIEPDNIIILQEISEVLAITNGLLVLP